LRIRHGAIVDNVVSYVYAKFGDDRLWNEKALADRKSNNNNRNTKYKKNNVGGAWGPVPRPKKMLVVSSEKRCVKERSQAK